jgi:hypothetical protein
MRVFSFGGGVQSMSVMVLSAQGVLPYTHFLFANVGDDSENPATIEYVQNIAVPFAIEHKLELIQVKRTGKWSSLYQQIVDSPKNIPIPVYISGKPAKRICTSDWKIDVITKWMKQNADAKKGSRKPIGVGISLDEYQRIRTDDESKYPFTYTEYPLIDMRMNRSDCLKTIAGANLPPPPKSSCWFCPYTKMREWTEMKRTNPELFGKAVGLEKLLIERHGNTYDSIFLTPVKSNMENSVPDPTMNMFADDETDYSCESGHCMT